MKHNIVATAAILAAIGSFASTAAFAQKANQATGLQVTNVTDADTLANDLTGAGITIVPGSATLIGQVDSNGNAQQGTFTTTGPDVVGFNSGIILGSGYASNVIGPNSVSNITGNWFSAGDADLTALSGVQTNDANVLSFQFTTDPGIQNAGFKFVFGSEEYDEFVGSSFNDSFEFVINGTNVALVGGLPISINTIDNGSNAADFIDNTDGHVNTELDGLTTVLSANIQPYLNIGGVNTLKLAIADGSDTAYDSDVFIQAGSFGNGGNGGGTTNATPEPSSFAGMGIGILGLLCLAVRARKMNKAAQQL